MGVSEFFQSVWDFVCRPFEECTSCCDVLDPDYYRKTSPGVHRTPQMFNRWDRDVKFDFTQSRPPSSLPPSSQSHVQHSKVSSGSASSRSGSRSASPMNYSYEEEDDEERHVQFLFYGGSDPPTPTSAEGLGGYRSDMISNYVQREEPISPASYASPRICHEMPFFSAQSPMSAPIYSPHLFKVSEQRQRRSAGYYSR